ncbi:MAG: NTP/NDP exchange transporter [Candidatus Binatia bacterium]
MQSNTRLTPLERFLGTFTDIRAGEGLTGLILFANVFLILCAYYFIKPLRDSWIAVSNVEGLSTMEVKAYSSFGQSLLLAGVASLFATLSARIPRGTLITRSTLVCMSNLVLFWALQPGYFLDNLPYAGVAFYLWVGMFGVFIVAQFWTMAADLYAGERGTRLLPLIAIGATAGAASGSYLTGALVGSGVFDSGSLLLFANVPLGLSILLTRAADARGPLGSTHAASSAIPERAHPLARGAAKSKGMAAAAAGAGKGAVSFIFRHPYLVSVALVVMLSNWVNTNGENLLFRVIQDNLAADAAALGITGEAERVAFLREGTTLFYGNFFFWVNVVALFAQAFLASRLLRYGGFGVIMLMLPSIALVSYSAMALLPVLAVVRVLKIAENATDYSINNTARQVLWLPTTAEMKYRAKPAIDSLFVRLGDGFAALTVLVGVHFLDLSTQSLFVVNVTLVVAWLVLSVAVVRGYARMTASSLAPAPA